MNLFCIFVFLNMLNEFVYREHEYVLNNLFYGFVLNEFVFTYLFS